MMDQPKCQTPAGVCRPIHMSAAGAVTMSCTAADKHMTVYCHCPFCIIDYLKCPHAMAWGTTNLIFSVLEFKQVYEASGQLNVALGTIKWALDWLVKAHVKAGNSPGDNAFVGQVSSSSCGGGGGRWYRVHMLSVALVVIIVGLQRAKLMVGSRITSRCRSKGTQLSKQADTIRHLAMSGVEAVHDCVYVWCAGVRQERPPLLWPS